jgi:hypothetical protein
MRTMGSALEQARRQVALLTAYARYVADLHDERWTGRTWTGRCSRCGERWPCPERIEADRVLLAVSTFEAPA